MNINRKHNHCKRCPNEFLSMVSNILTILLRVIQIFGGHIAIFIIFFRKLFGLVTSLAWFLYML